MKHWIYWGDGTPARNAVYSTDETLSELKAKYGLTSECVDQIAYNKSRAWVMEFGECSRLVPVSTRWLVYETWRGMYKEIHGSVFMNYQHFQKNAEYKAAINLYKPNRSDRMSIGYGGRTYDFVFSLTDLHLVYGPKEWDSFLNVNMLEYETPKEGPLWRGMNC